MKQPVVKRKMVTLNMTNEEAMFLKDIVELNMKDYKYKHDETRPCLHFIKKLHSKFK